MLRSLSVAIVVSAWCLSSSWAGDWPAYRHDARRSSVTDETLRFPLHLAWRYQCVQPPAPAFPAITPLDAWDLCFDFRPFDSRYGLYDPGAFRVRVTPRRGPNHPAAVQPLTDLPQPRLRIAGTAASGRTETVVELPWAEIRQLIGAQPKSFGFAATLTVARRRRKRAPHSATPLRGRLCRRDQQRLDQPGTGRHTENQGPPAIVAGPALPKSIGATAGK